MHTARLKLVRGGRDAVAFRSYRICLQSDQAAPQDRGMRIVEDDTFAVVGADTWVRDIPEHPVRLMTALIDQQPVPVGTVVARCGCLHAIIYDLDADIVCQPAWVRRALVAALRRADQAGANAVTLALPGVRYGGLPLQESLSLLLEILAMITPLHLREITIVVPARALAPVQQMLAHIAARTG